MILDNVFVLPIIRRNYPSSIKGELSQEFPIQEDTRVFLGDFAYDRMEISGGWYHSFLKGWKWDPWQLINVKGKVSRYESKGLFNLIPTTLTSTEIIDTCDSIADELPESYSLS